MGISRTGCVFTGVELCTRMMQFSGLYIVLSLLSLLCIGLSLSVTDADLATYMVFLGLVRLLLGLATIVCLYRILNQFGGVLHDVTLIRRACAGWVFVRFLSWFAVDDAEAYGPLRSLRLVGPLSDFVFFGILFRSAYSTRQKLEREGEPEGNLYALLGPHPSTGPVSQLQPQQQQGVIMGQPQQGVIVQPQQQQGVIMGQPQQGVIVQPQQQQGVIMGQPQQGVIVHSEAGAEC